MSPLLTFSDLLLRIALQRAALPAAQVIRGISWDSYIEILKEVRRQREIPEPRMNGKGERPSINPLSPDLARDEPLPADIIP